MVEGVKMLRIQLSMSLFISLLPIGIGTPLWAYSPQSASEAAAASGTNQETPKTSQVEVEQLKALLLEQKKAIEELRAEILHHKSLIEKLENQRDGEDPKFAGTPGIQSTSATMVPVNTTSLKDTEPSSSASASQAVLAKPDTKGEEKPATNALAVNGFKFSGDFRFRADVQARSSNSVAGPLQNVRARYRLRLNIDKDIDRRFRTHIQLSTAPLANEITNDQDFAGVEVKHTFSLAEAYVDFHPNATVSMRGGRMEEVFADNTRFLWDDDVRFNGFQQILKLPIGANNSLELRAGEYWMTNPNVVILSATSPFVAAGYQQGQKVRDTNMFHPGAVLNLSRGGPWKHQLIGDFQIYRNANQIQLASTADGFPVVVNPAIGLALSGPLGGTGNAVRTPGGAEYTAPDFHIARFSYRIDHSGPKLWNREMPFWFNFQVSRNTRAGFLRDAVAGSVNLGAIKNTGDVRFLYQYIIKDANALISQFTDDDLGTGSGANIAVHALRVDIGLTHFLQWQSLLFIQHERRGNNPDELFFVPLRRGANATFRYLGQLAFTF